jgi:hypothetical protein
MRSYLVIKDRKIKLFSIITTGTLSIGLLISLISLVYWHIHMATRSNPMQERVHALEKTSKYNLAQLILFSSMIFENTILLIAYIGRNLIQNEGYLNYLKKSFTAKLGLLLLIDQTVELIITILQFRGVFKISKTYVHATNITLVLFAKFYLYASVLDVSNAVRTQNRSSSTTRKSTMKGGSRPVSRSGTIISYTGGTLARPKSTGNSCGI